MGFNRKLILGVALASSVAAAPSAHAAIVTETFTDGTLVGGADNSGAAWYDRSANTSIAAVDDSAGIGSGNALGLTIVSSQVNRPVLGVINSSTLSGVGSAFSLSFDFRFLAAPGNSTDAFRFGLYNSNGTPVNANDTAQSDDDFGYEASIGSGTTPAFNLFKEPVNTPDGAGNTGSGNDRVSLAPTVANTFAVNDTLKHSGVLTLTRSASGVNFSVSVDGTTLGTGSDNTSPNLTFDELLFVHGINDAYRIDNIVLTPEPASLGVLGLGAIGLLARRPRRA